MVPISDGAEANLRHRRWSWRGRTRAPAVRHEEGAMRTVHWYWCCWCSNRWLSSDSTERKRHHAWHLDL